MHTTVIIYLCFIMMFLVVLFLFISTKPIYYFRFCTKILPCQKQEDETFNRTVNDREIANTIPEIKLLVHNFTMMKYRSSYYLQLSVML